MKKKKKLKTRRRNPTQKRSLETTNAILEAAAQLLERDGNYGYTTNHIAERAGVSIGALYQYFPDKDAILTQLFLRELHEDAASLEKVLLDLGQSEIETVVPRLIEVILRRLSERPKLRKVLKSKAAASGQIGHLKDIKRQLAEMLTAYLRSHPQFRIRRDIRLEMLIVVSSVEAALNAAIEELKPNRRSRRLVHEVSDLVLRYLSKYRVPKAS